MAGNSVAVIFFDLGDTLGTPSFSPPPVHLAGFDVFPFVPTLLQDLKSRGLRLGLISNTGDDPGVAVDSVLREAAIVDLFEPMLRIYSKDVDLTKDTPRIFELAVARAGLSSSPRSCLFVGENARERANAMAAGLRVCPDPLMIPQILSEAGP